MKYQPLLVQGQVINPQQLAQVTEAGAIQFAISPGLTDALLKAAVAGSIPLIPWYLRLFLN